MGISLVAYSVLLATQKSVYCDHGFFGTATKVILCTNGIANINEGL